MNRFLSILVLTVCVSVVVALEAELLMKPTTVVLNGDVQLSCKYTENQDKIYDISFYKDGMQFFFFRRRSGAWTWRSFPNVGLNVKYYDESKNTVRLIGAIEEYEGRYWCEVTLTDVYNFTATESSHVNLIVGGLGSPSLKLEAAGSLSNLASLTIVFICLLIRLAHL